MKNEIYKDGILISVEEIPEDPMFNIQVLESQVTNRRLREATLTTEGKAWLTDQEALIAAERAKL